MTNDFMIYLEYRLDQWAQWYSVYAYGLGYPPCSNEYHFMTVGILVPSSKVPDTGYTNYEAEEIEDLVKQMAQFNSVMAEALRCHYFVSGALRSKCKRLHMSHTHFKHCVDMAHHWLAGRLSR